MPLFLLTYDQSLPEYEGIDFRKVIIEFFLEREIGCELESPVRSTIYIETEKLNPLKYWNGQLSMTFDSDYFFFTLAEIRRDYSSEQSKYKIRENTDIDIFNSFYDLVEEIREHLS